MKLKRIRDVSNSFYFSFIKQHTTVPISLLKASTQQCIHYYFNMRYIKTVYSTVAFNCWILATILLCPLLSQAYNLDSLKVVLNRETKDKTMLSLIKHAANHSHKDMNLALAYLSVANDNALAAKNDKDLFDIERETGFLYEENNQLDNALTHFQKALNTAKKLNDQISMITIYTDLAIVNEKQGKYAIAKDYHIKSITVAKDENDLETVENAYHGLGSLYETVGDYDKAIEYYLQSLEIAENRKSESGVIITLQSLANTYNLTKNEKFALQTIEKAYQQAIDLNDQVLIANTSYDFGKILNDHGYLDEALEKQLGSLEIFQKIEDHIAIARGYVNVGEIYTKKKMYKEAKLYFLEAKKEKNYISTFDNTNLYHNLGILYQELNNIPKSNASFVKSLELSKKNDFKQLSLQNNYKLYQLYSNLGDHKKSLSHLETYIELNNYMLNQEKTKRILEMQFKFDVEKSEKEIQSLMLQQNKLLFLGSSLLFTFLTLFLIYVIKLKGNNNNMLLKKNEEIKNQNLRLEESNDVLKQFAYVAAHDLKEPLRNIGSFVSLIQKRFGGDFNEEANEYMNYVIKGVKRMNNLLGDLLRYSRITEQSAETELIKLDDILEEVSCNLRERIITSKAVIKTPPPLPAIRMSRIHLLQIFQNLISNALKFVEKDPVIVIDGNIKNDEFIISIQDNGIGIKKEYEHKIFNLFHQLNKRKQYEGTGIGLTICKNIVDKYNGKIWFESAEGKGTTFFISLPISVINKSEVSESEEVEFEVAAMM